jgi:hypothetical protein
VPSCTGALSLLSEAVYQTIRADVLVTQPIEDANDRNKKSDKDLTHPFRGICRKVTHLDIFVPDISSLFLKNPSDVRDVFPVRAEAAE